ncbi:efflux RND transporter periplasmic adaptor subunit [Desulfoferula mesophila]|uniref:MexE family multidrug efflux RND transporter periplasmic adaptor subunit n=1 Tax=Desulfoferula mesophila TaxID=3058419 RepID=A0AAU9ESX3_9BACT|nr:MexE family multidrug efflux RND transporter periplasmic adaptor subunit [Desulfoferula mesophilus]
MKMGKSRQALIALALAAGLTLAVAGCDRGKEKMAAPPAPVVTVATPVTRTVTDYAVYTGNTQAQFSVDIMARVEGQLRSVNFDVGSHVKKGQLLFVIEPEPYMAKVDIAKANQAVAQAQLQLAQATLVRKENAFKDRAVSEVDVIQAKAQEAEAQAQVQAAKAQLERTRIDYGYTHIHAPISGRVSRNLVDVGNLVGAGQTTKLTSIVMDDPIYAYFTVAESDVMKYRANQRDREVPLNAQGYPLASLGAAIDQDYPHKGYLDWIDNKVDPGTGTIQMRGVFPNSDGVLVPGLFVRVQVPVGVIKDAILTEDRALGRDQRGTYLLVVDQDNVVQYRPVETGPVQTDGKIVILKGLQLKDRVIINGLQRVRPGAKCTPMTPEQVKQAQAAAREKAMAQQKGKAPEAAATKEKPAQGAK